MAIELATAYISIIPETSKIAPGVRKAFGSVDKEAAAAGKRSGGFFSNALSTASGMLLAKAAVGIGAAFGKAVTGGFDRAVKLQSAEAKLKALQVPAGRIGSLMDQANKAVLGTAFGMDQSVSTAARFFGAGKTGMAEMERALRNTANAAAVAGTDMDTMGGIFAKAAGQNKVMGDTLQQLSENGLDVVPMLAKSLNVTTAEVFKLASEGKISFDQFQTALEQGLDPRAAQIMGNTLDGALKNTAAALSRLGAGVFTAFTPVVTGLLSAAQGGLKQLEGMAKPVAESIAKGVQGVWSILSKGDFVGPDLTFGLQEDSPIVDVLFRLREGLVRLWGAMQPLGKAVTDLWAVFQPLITGLATMAIGVVVAAWEAFTRAIAGLTPIIAAVTGWLRENDVLVRGIAVTVLAAVAAWKAYTAVKVAWMAVTTGIPAILAAVRVAMLALNAAMRANPIGIIITALTALVAGLVYAYKNSETFRNIVNAAFSGIKAVVGAVVGWFTDTVIPFFVGLWQKIAGGEGGGPNIFIRAWNGIKEFFAGLWAGVTAGIQDFLNVITYLFLTWTTLGLIISNWSTISTFFQNLWANVIAVFQGAINWVTGVFGAIWATVGPLISFPFELGWKVAQAVLILIMRGLQATADWVATVFAAAWGLLQTYIVQPILNGLALLQPLWNAIVTGFTWLKDMAVAAVTALVNGSIMLWNLLSSTVNAVVTALVNFVVGQFNFWRDTINAITTAIRDFVVANWTQLRDLVFGIVTALVTTVTNNFNAWRDALTAAAGQMRDWIVERFESLRAGAVDLFTKMVDGIGKVWDGLKAVAAAPVRFVIDTVINNGIIKGWNDLVGLLKLDEKLKMQPLSVPGFAHGGILPGPGTSRGDDMIVVNRRGVPQATVASGEPIISRKAYAKNKPIVDSIIAGKQLPGFFQGGYAPVPGGRVTNQHPHPYYGTRYAADLAMPIGTPVSAWHAGTVAAVAKLSTSYGWNILLNHAANIGASRYAHLSRIDVNPGQQVQQGQVIGAVGSTGNSTGPHLHFEIIGGNVPLVGGVANDGGGLAGMAMQWITDKLSAPVKALIEKIPGQGMFTEAAKGMANKMLDSVMEKVRSLVPAGSDGAMSGAMATGDWAANARLLMQAGKQLGLDRRAMKIALMTAAQESSMGTNRTAMTQINRDGDVGWFQQRATRGDGTVAQLADPLYSLGVFIHGKRVPAGYHVPGLYNKNWQSMGLGQAAQAVQVSAYPSAYDKWADEAEMWLNQFGYDRGGWLKPGVTMANNQTGKPEAVLTASQWDTTRRILDRLEQQQLREQASKSGDMGGVKIDVHANDMDEAVRKLTDELRWSGLVRR